MLDTTVQTADLNQNQGPNRTLSACLAPSLLASFLGMRGEETSLGY